MERLKMHTPNLADENFAKLAALFPNAVTETKDENGNVVRAIDADVLRQEISATVVEGSQERYQFTWPDKKKSVVLANQPIAKTLRLDREKSVGRDGTSGSIDTENIYIEGDNLDALKLLQETYLGKVKMIYIDPPYNTGNDFIYEDDFSQSADEYLGNSGQFDEEGNRLVQNPESNGRFHTDWLNMLYPRLRLAKDLLSDDGVIVISINEYEESNLRRICDEIFGYRNRVCCFDWQTKKAAQGMTTANMIVTNNEYIYVYAKKPDFFRFRGLDRNEDNGFSNPDHDFRGPWKRQYLQRFGQGLPVRTITDPTSGTVFSFETPYTQDKLDRWIQEDRIIFPTDPKKYPARKEFLNEYENRQQLVTELGLFATKATTERLYGLFNGIKIFTNPKPDTLIKFLIQQTTQQNSIVFDFFSGSATTAHAVMQLNAEDGGHRKFIMVQLPEQTDSKSEAYKAGYKTICEIGEERIRRAGKKIKEENPLTTADLDIGFRVFKVDSSNMEDVYYRPADYNQGQMELFADNIKPDRTPEDLLFQVMLDLGILLSSDIQETEIAGKKVFSVADGYLIACFDKDVTEETVKAIAQKQPVYAVFRDSSMASDSVATNFEQIFETYSPRTQRKVL